MTNMQLASIVAGANRRKTTFGECVCIAGILNPELSSEPDRKFVAMISDGVFAAGSRQNDPVLLIADNNFDRQLLDFSFSADDQPVAGHLLTNTAISRDLLDGLGLERAKSEKFKFEEVEVGIIMITGEEAVKTGFLLHGNKHHVYMMAFGEGCHFIGQSLQRRYGPKFVLAVKMVAIKAMLESVNKPKAAKVVANWDVAGPQNDYDPLGR